MNPPKKQIRIAVVDDHTLFRKCLANFINSEDNNRYYILFDADSGADLMKKLDRNRLPDIIILDIGMPGMNGFEIVKWLQQNHPTVEILVVSMIESEDAIVKMIKLGVKGYLSKDIDPEDLHAALNDISRGEYHYTKFLTGKLIHSVLKETGAEKNNGILSDAEKKWNKLTQREKEFITLACTEDTYQEIAGKLFVSAKTVDGYRESVFEKLEVKNRIALVLFAIKNKFVEI